MDGLLGACQNTLKQKHRSDNTAVRNKSLAIRAPGAMETMLYINLYATLILIPCSYYAGQFQHGMSMLLFPSNTDTQTENTSKLLLQLNLSASLGQVFVFLTIHHFSPLTCTTVTTTRKFFTILLSVYKFGHVLDVWQWSSVGLVFGGLYLEIAAKFIEEKGDSGVDDDDGMKQKVE
jgi:UDP-galactose transporter B1